MCSRYCLLSGVRCKWRNNTCCLFIYQILCQWDNCIPTHKPYFRGSCQIWLVDGSCMCKACFKNQMPWCIPKSAEANERPLCTVEQHQSPMAMNFKIVHFWMPNSSRSKKFWHSFSNFVINYNWKPSNVRIFHRPHLLPQNSPYYVLCLWFFIHFCLHSHYRMMTFILKMPTSLYWHKWSHGELVSA